MRKQARRSFTVEIKQSPSSRRTFIPAKPLQASERGKPLTDPALASHSVFEPRVMPPSGASKAKEPRRILPNLIVWEPSKPEPEPQVLPEDPLPRVRRAVVPQDADDALRREDRPETPTPEPEDAIHAQPESLPTQTLAPVQAVSVKAARADRSARAEEVVLPRAE